MSSPVENAYSLPPRATQPPTPAAGADPAITPEAARAGQSPIAGSVLPIERAEELLATLPGVISARILATAAGSVEAIHVLTSDEVGAKQTVRNVESALLAHLGMHVSHKRISVATSTDPAGRVAIRAAASAEGSRPTLVRPVEPPKPQYPKRKIYFEDVEVRRSRTRGVACRVTLRKGEQTFVGEAEGLENERLRIELAARAAVTAILQSEGEARAFALEGCRTIEGFDREFVFVGVTAKWGRDGALLTGSAEVRGSPETAAVLAVLDATNRWLEYDR